MPYEVSILTANINGVRRWNRLHQKPIRKKSDAIALADNHDTHAVVTIASTNTVIYFTNKPHGGEGVNRFLPRCRCSNCEN